MKPLFAMALLACTCGAAHAARLQLTEMCDPSMESTSANFQGHNADEVAKELRKVVTPRDEYESETAYAERIEQALKGLPQAISTGSLCVVDQNLGLGNTKYDPDSQVLWANVFLKSNNFWFDGADLHQDFQVFVSERNRKESSYTGSNAFGASTRVSKLERAATYVTFDSKETTSALHAAGITERENIYLSVPIEIAPAEARALHGNVRIVYQYRLRPPYLGTYEDFELPKLDWPSESRENQTLVA